MASRRSRKTGKLGSNSSIFRAKRLMTDRKKRNLFLEKLEERVVFAAGPLLETIQPNNGSILSFDSTKQTTLRVSPQELSFNFSNSAGVGINPGSLSTTGVNSSIRLVRQNFDNNFGTNDITINPGFIGLGDSSAEVIMRFAEPLPDDNYRVIVGTNLSDVSGNGATAAIVDFKLELGAQVSAVVPQPITRQANGVLKQETKNVEVYFTPDNDDFDPKIVQDPKFYRLIVTGDTVSPADDVVIKPTSVKYIVAPNKADSDKVILTFAQPLEVLNPNNYAWRLRVGTNEGLDASEYSPITANDPASTFSGALNAQTLSGTKVYTDGIYTSSIPAKQYDIQWPGGNDDPGHRDFPDPGEVHISDDATDGAGITIRYYNFRTNIGSISNGQGGSQPAFNEITANQKQRAREIFDLYSRYSGIQFVESESLGTTVATGDLRVADPTILSEPGGVAGLGSPALAIMDKAEDWSNDKFGGSWFQVAMHEIGHALGLGHTYDLQSLTIQGNDGAIVTPSPGPEPVFPGDGDIVHMRRLYRPEGQDIDMYRFSIASGEKGMFTAEVFAERLTDSSLLDSFLRLYKVTADGNTLIASNDDYFSKDSRIQLQLEEGTYFVGVSAKGNESYDPTIWDSGIGGTSEGTYRLRLDFDPNVTLAASLTDKSGTPIDGDADGTAGGVYDFWFKTAKPMETTPPPGARTEARTIYVDKVSPAGGNGSLARPFNRITQAVTAAKVKGDVIRIVGNGGTDGRMDTVDDNFAYQIGFEATNGTPLTDGYNLIVPKNVTVMADAGAIFHMYRSHIQVGSTQVAGNNDRSGGGFQALGTPDTSVYFTSYNDREIGKDPNTQDRAARPGDWGGILFRNDKDHADGRFEWEHQGVFVNYVNHADIRYGGGSVNLDGGPTDNGQGEASNVDVISPIHMVDARPTVSFNTITRNASSAMSANPNSFEETSFAEPRYQPDGMYGKAINVDYVRIGPDIYNNTLLNNSRNGLEVRVTTLAGKTPEQLDVAGRFDDTTITHLISENLQVAGTPGGPTREGALFNPADNTISDGKPPITLVRTFQQTTGTLTAGATYNYRLVYVDEFGNEGRASDVITVRLTGTNRGVRFDQFPKPATSSDFVARRLYRAGADGVYRYVAQIPATQTTYTDTNARPDFVRVLNSGLYAGTTGASIFLERPRMDGSLRIDPNIVVKVDGRRIELGLGATMIAEGDDGGEVIFTSFADDRFGAGGTFDTSNDGNRNLAQPGQWGGIYAGPNSRLSLDHVKVFYAGGLTVLGEDFAGFNAVEIHQADARIADSLFQFNANGSGGTAQADRFGLQSNGSGVIFVRGAQPVIVNNVIRDNTTAAAVNINANALNSEIVVDGGRQTKWTQRVPGFLENKGPLVNGNLLDNNSLNGMIVRGALLTTESVWDDTGIVHIMLDTTSVTEVHTYGGLRLVSKPTESLVIKAYSRTGSEAGFYANGRPLEIDDRLGGILQVLGQPGFPVIMTSLTDDTVGAGFKPDRSPITDTNNDGAASTQQPGDWRGVVIDKYAHDRNVAAIMEKEDPRAAAPGSNGVPARAQGLGLLSAEERDGDENLRLGFTVYGAISSPADVDVYSFSADAGTEVWFDIDRTAHALDSVVELVDSDGIMVARSQDSEDELAGSRSTPGSRSTLEGNARTMQRQTPYEGRDFYTTNPRDGGMRVILPGPAGTPSTYNVRVRSSSGDLKQIDGGLTQGAYQLQVRLREKDEFAGTSVQYADIRNAINGIELRGQPTHSPLTGEHGEITGRANDTLATAQYIGNALTHDRGSVSISGSLTGETDVDWYRFDLNMVALQGFIGAGQPATKLFSAIFDMDYADGFGRPNTMISVFDSTGRLVLNSRDSNVADDRSTAVTGSTVEDLARGSAGTADPFIGPAMMPAGVNTNPVVTYYVAVSGDAQIPAQWDQFFTAQPTNPLFRLEPTNSIERIVEDHIDDLPGYFSQHGTAALADVQVVLDDSSAVPFNLGDVTLYLTRDAGAKSSQLVTVDPFTGTHETFLGGRPYEIGDLAFRNDKELFSYSMDTSPDQPPGDVPTDAEAGHFLQYDTGTGAITDLGDDGIVTSEYVPNSQTVDIDTAHLVNNTRVGWGVNFEAMVFGPINNPNEQNLLVVGNRGEYYAGAAINPLVSPKRNLMFQMNTGNGTPIVSGGPGQDQNGNYFGGLNSAYEVGEVLTSPTLIPFDATTLNNTGGTNRNVLDGTSFSVRNETSVVGFEMDTGPEVISNVNLNITGQQVRDGNFFVLDADTNLNNNAGDVIFQFDTGTVISINVPSQAALDGQTITINDIGGTGTSRTFEFDTDGQALNGNAVAIDIAGAITSGGIAGFLADAINGEYQGAPGFNTQAAVVGNRVTLINDGNVFLSAGLTAANRVSLSGAAGRAPILQAVPGANITDGQTFTIQRVGQTAKVFEFNRTGGVQAGRTAIPYTSAMTAAQIAIQMENAIAGAFPTLSPNDFLQRVGDRLVVNGNGVGGNLFLQGTSPIAELFTTKQVVQVSVEENFQNQPYVPNNPPTTVPPADSLGFAIARDVMNNSQFTVGYDLARFNFPAPVTPAVGAVNRIAPLNADFRGVPVFTTVAGSAVGVGSGKISVPFLAQDTAADLAVRTSLAINGYYSRFPTNVVPFSQSEGTRVYVNGNASFTTVDAPFIARGEGPGGIITGMAILGTTLYGVSDAGGLYIINPDIIGNRDDQPDDPGKVDHVNTTYVRSSQADLKGIQFAGLTKGPANVENGRYANMLFAVDTNGRLYAFNTAGQLQSVFADGATSVQLYYVQLVNGVYVRNPATNASGIAFSQLTENLWHITPFNGSERGGDAGHGMTLPFDGSRDYLLDTPNPPDVLGRSSYHFADNNQGTPFAKSGNTYDANGGAYGTLVSNDFSLVGYSAADAPMLYFNYFLEAGAGNTDSFRLFISGRNVGGTNNTGEWVRVAADQVASGDGTPRLGLGGQTFKNSGSWRQARVNLSQFAGWDNLRMRMDFSTAGDMNVGDVLSTGDELRAVAAEFIDDGDLVTLDNDGDRLLTPNDLQDFEFEQGFTLVVPTAKQINDGDTLRIVGPNATVVFEFDKNGTSTATNRRITITNNMSAATVTQLIVQAVTAAFPQTGANAVIAYDVGGNRVNLQGSTTLLPDRALAISAGPSEVTKKPSLPITILGDKGVDAGNVRVPIHREMSREQVALQLRHAMEQFYYQQKLVVRGDGTDYQDGDSFTIAVNGQVFDFEFETGLVIGLPAAGAVNGPTPFVADGDTITLRRTSGGTTTTVVYEFDNNNTLSNGTNRRVRFRAGDLQIDVADALSTAINATPAATRNALGITTTQVISGGRVHVGGARGITFATSKAAAYTSTGTAGLANPTATTIRYVPSSFFDSQQIAQAINSALNVGFTGTNFTAVYNPNDPSRIELRGVLYDDFQLQNNPGNLQISLTTMNGGGAYSPSNLVKVYKDLVRVIGHSVYNPNEADPTLPYPGPLGLENDLSADIDPSPAAPIFPYQYAGYTAATRGQNNNFEGMYIDDIIVGFAERGELASGATANSNFIANPFFQRFADGTPVENVTGPYQLEIRRGDLYNFPHDIFGEIYPNGPLTPPTFNTNDRLTAAQQLVIPAGAFLVDGETFILSDGVRSVTFEFDADGRVTQGNSIIPYTANDDSAATARAVRDAINRPDVQAELDMSAQLSDGTLFGGVSSDSRINLVGTAVVTWTRRPGNVIRTDNPYGDRNLFRDQGQILIDGTKISNSQSWGILVDDGSKDNGTAAHQSAVRLLDEPNVDRLVPGVVLSNNVIYGGGAGGIRFSGTATNANEEPAAVPYGRLINNSLYGGGGTLNNLGRTDVGIQVDQNASPTLLNNIVANFTEGVNIDNTSRSSVLGGMVFQGNGTNSNAGVGLNNPILLANTDPLFVNPAGGNFYLMPQSEAIDSAVNFLGDRATLIRVRNPLGITPSQVLAPARDGNGLLRVDDPDVANEAQNVIKDRGALDRSDFIRPRSTILNPKDNDSEGIDLDRTSGVITLPEVALFNFTIQLTDDGAGIDDATARNPANVTLEVLEGTAAPRTLVNGIDYTHSYDATNNRIILRPTGNIWPTGKDYRITLSNAIQDIAGNTLQPNQLNQTVVYLIKIGTGIDYGDAPNSYKTLKASNGPSHPIVSRLFLGAGVSSDTDGKPTAESDGDSLDDGLLGYSIRPGAISTMTLRITGSGKLSAWLDYDKDGVFETSEELFIGRDVSAGIKSQSFTFGTSATPKGIANLRLRLSSTSVTSPFGPANNGEVEDYRIQMSTPAFQNPINSMDVDANGDINSTDALKIVNFVTKNDTNNDGIVRPSDVPGLKAPPYYDVNGDGVFTNDDADIIKDFLNGQSSSSKSAAAASAPAATTTSSTTSADAFFAAVATTPTATTEEKKKSTTVYDEVLASSTATGTDDYFSQY